VHRDAEAVLLMLVTFRHVSASDFLSLRRQGRTDQQCMGRWRRHLDPAIRYGHTPLATADTQLLLSRRRKIPTLVASTSTTAWMTHQNSFAMLTPGGCARS
jgi:hypothetical protein